MAITHISEAEAVRDFAGVLSRLHAGEEIVIDTAVASVTLSLPARGRSLAESIALAEALACETGIDPVMDDNFAADMREIIARRKPRDHSAWD